MTTTVTNELLAYLPELKQLVKSAEAVEGLSTKTREDTLFSSVKVAYLEKVAHVYVDPLEAAKVRKAAGLYGIDKIAEDLSTLLQSKVALTKTASLQKQAELVVAQENFDNLCGGFKNVDRLVKAARALYDSFEDQIESDNVKLYACAGHLNKTAALRGLQARAKASGNEAFEKLAEALPELDTQKFTLEEKRKFADYVNELDKKANLQTRGFDFYNEVFIVKEAAMAGAITVKLSNNKEVPISKIQAVAPDLVDALGADVVKELKKDAYTAKAVVDSLPLDLKTILAKYC